jgi:hypothetical protein
VVVDTIFSDIGGNVQSIFGVNIQKDVSVTEKRSEFLLNLFQRIQILDVRVSLA